MLSDMDWLFAEQEAIMNGPSESVEDYLARRQRRWVPFLGGGSSSTLPWTLRLSRTAARKLCMLSFC